VDESVEEFDASAGILHAYEVAELYHVVPATIWAWNRRGRFPARAVHRNPGGGLMFSRAWVRENTGRG
jgi:hypothetical protein